MTILLLSAIWDANKGVRIRKLTDHSGIVNSCTIARVRTFPLSLSLCLSVSPLTLLLFPITISFSMFQFLQKIFSFVSAFSIPISLFCIFITHRPFLLHPITVALLPWVFVCLCFSACTLVSVCVCVCVFAYLSTPALPLRSLSYLEEYPNLSLSIVG